jgi:hypothetical protein
MQDNYFDELLRMKLHSWEAPAEEPDWSTFVAKWEGRFDQALAEKLMGLSVPFDPADWQLFQHQLGHPLDAAIGQQLAGLQAASPLESDWAAMSERLEAPFDQSIQQKLEEVQAVPQPQDWEAMGASLLSPLDQTLRNKLRELESPLPAEGWESLAHRLDGGATFWPQQATRLLLEGAVILLLLVFLGEKAFFRPPLAGPADEQPVYQAAIASEPEQTTAVTISSSPTLELASDDVNASQDASSLISQETVAAAVPPTRSELPAEPMSALPEERMLLTVQDSTADQPESRNSSSLLLAEEPETAKVASFPANKQSLFISPVAFQASGSRISSGISIQALLRSKPVQPYPRVKLGLTATHLTTVSELNDQGKQGMALGIRSILQLSPRLSLVSGLQYAEKQFDRMVFNTYQDNAGAARQGSYWVSRLKAEFQMLEVPILLRYQFSANPRVNLYFQAGVSPMFSLSERYYHYDPRSANNLSQTLSNPQIDLSTNPDNNRALQAYLDQLEPVMQTQSINTYLGNLQFAPGIQVKIANRASLELEPYLQVGIQSLGSAQKKMHSAGASISLLYHLHSGSTQR